MIGSKRTKAPAPFGGVYGPPGGGKTTAAAAFIWYAYERTKKPALYCDEEQGVVAFPDALVEGKHYEIWMPTKEVKGKIVATDAVDDVVEIPEEAATGKYSCLIHDTVTAFAGRAMKSVVAKNLTTGGRGTQRVHVETSNGTTINHPTMQDYGVVASVLENYLNFLLPVKDAGVPVLWLGHDRLITADDEDGNTLDAVGSMELVGKQMPRNAPKLMAFLVRLVAKKKKGVSTRSWMTEGDGTWLAKDRLGVWSVSEDVTVEKGGKSQEAFKEESVEIFIPLWEAWITQYEKRFGKFWEK